MLLDILGIEMFSSFHEEYFYMKNLVTFYSNEIGQAFKECFCVFFMWLFCPNVWKQISQINGFLFSCTVLICLLSLSKFSRTQFAFYSFCVSLLEYFCPNVCWHIFHSKGIWVSCTDLMCLIRLIFRPNCDPHNLHSKGFIEPWTVFMCILSFTLEDKSWSKSGTFLFPSDLFKHWFSLFRHSLILCFYKLFWTVNSSISSVY